MKEQHKRTALLFGEDGMEKLKGAHVCVFGLGGVGASLTLALARAGVGELTIVDSDNVSESNINRQLIAFHSTVGKTKCEVCEDMIRDIDPEITVHPVCRFILPENLSEMDFSSFDYVADAIDTVSAKIAIIEECTRLGVPIISCMGTGNKTDPTALTLSDLSKTSVCPLAKVMRYELRKRDIKKLTVVWSPEEPKKSAEREGGRIIPASCSFVPPAAGLIMSGHIIKSIIGL